MERCARMERGEPVWFPVGGPRQVGKTMLFLEFAGRGQRLLTLVKFIKTRAGGTL
jgi:predicted AAA+ superfamily ATPase